MVCDRFVEDYCVSRAILSRVEMVCVARRGGDTRTNVSRLGLWCRGLLCRCLLG